MKRILIVAGTRPEIIKLAPVIITAKSEFKHSLQIVFCLTGQHSVMARQAIEIFSLTPDLDLKIMERNQALNSVSMKIFHSFPGVLKKYSPDLVMVQGDTTTAAVSGLVAFNMRIPVAHVEAGLRTFRLDAPYPEELNRRIISAFSLYNFAPTENSKSNLLRENVPEEKIYVTGNTVVDALEYIRDNHDLSLSGSLRQKVRSPFVLVTAHRRESFGDGVSRIFAALRSAARKYPGIQFVYPVHPNPNVRNQAKKYLRDIGNFLLIPPVGYLELLALLEKCEFCITDSGGIQEEAPSFEKFTIVLRDATERTESIRAGLSVLAGTNPEKIIEEIDHRLLARKEKPQKTDNPFGDGNASGRICRILSRTLK